MTPRPNPTSRRLALVALLAAAPALAAQQDPLLEVSGLGNSDRFGRVMALVGNVDGDGVDDYVVGAPQADLGGDRRGQVLVFSGADHSVLWVFDGTADLHEFGTSVDGAGDVDDDGRADIIIGEPWPYTLATAPGKAYVYSGADGSLLWTLTGEVVKDKFGAAVAGVGDIDGDGHDDVAVGAPNVLEAGAIDGRAVVFSGADGSVLLEVPLPEPGIMMGTSLDAMGDVSGDSVPDFVVGAERWQESATQPRQGSVLLISGADGALLTHGLVTGSSSSINTLGRSGGALGDVDADGTRDFWGAAGGRLLVWSGIDGTALFDSTCWTDSWDQPKAADLGDVDGDGHDDVLVGDPEAVGFETRAGHARVLSGATGQVLMIHRGDLFHGKRGSSVLGLGDADGDGRPEFLLGEPTHASQDPGLAHLVEYEPLGAAFSLASDTVVDGGWASARAAGDVDNDGAVDVIVGEPYDDSVANDAGRALVYSGRDGALLLTITGDANPDRAGWAVDTAGDVDGDGFDDVAVALPFRQTPLPGAVRVHSGRTGALLQQFDGHAYADRFGTSLRDVGDVDGDGTDDLLVGAPYDDTGTLDGGAAYLISGADGTELHAFFGTSFLSGFGHNVGGGGDVDGDGVPDLLVSVPSALVGPTSIAPGTVRVHSGADGDLLYVLAGQFNGDQFGVTPGSLAILGDVDGDGRADIAVGATGANDNLGTVSVFSGVDGQPLWTFELVDGEIGGSLADMGDMDGDDVPDLLVGAPDRDVVGSGEDSGEAWLLSGVDGAVLEVYASAPSPRLGSVVAGVGDLDLDGRSELVAVTSGISQPVPGLTFWHSSQGASPYQNRGGVLPGVAGDPRLFPEGSLLPGEPLTVTLSDAAPSVATWLVIGFSELGLPLEGGTLVPALDVVLAGLPTDATGTLVMSGPWPAGVPSDFTFFLQSWIPDGAGPFGFAASHGVRVIVP